jgi:hypothetical protein
MMARRIAGFDGLVTAREQAHAYQTVLTEM